MKNSYCISYLFAILLLLQTNIICPMSIIDGTKEFEILFKSRDISRDKDRFRLYVYDFNSIDGIRTAAVLDTYIGNYSTGARGMLFENLLYDNNIEGVRLLTSHGANVDKVFFDHSEIRTITTTPLNYALRNQKFEIAKILIHAGADVNKPDLADIARDKDVKISYPVHIVSAYVITYAEMIPIMKLLLKKGARLDKQSVYTWTHAILGLKLNQAYYPLTLAAHFGHYDLAEYLLPKYTRAAIEPLLENKLYYDNKMREIILQALANNMMRASNVAKQTVEDVDQNKKADIQPLDLNQKQPNELPEKNDMEKWLITFDEDGEKN